MKRFFLHYLIIILFLVTNSSFGKDIMYVPDSVPNCILENGLYFLGIPYVGNSLDKNDLEKLVCTNQHFDCVTFVEYVLALSLYQNQEQNNAVGFEDILQKLRYRDGKIEGYTSRLHYFSEWISQHEKAAMMRNISADLGGIPFNGKIDFMSKNASKYPKISSKKELNKISEVEAALNKSKFHYIPKSKVNEISHQLKNGDIIGITTNIKGLDFVHTGFIVFKNGDAHLLHASETLGKVVISEESLYDYLQKHPSQSGIVVCRPY